MLSAHATSGQINRFREAGARDYLTKPLEIRRFYALLDEYCTDRDASSNEYSTEEKILEVLPWLVEIVAEG